MAHPDNKFYGHNRALLRAAGASESDVIHGHVQHGWMPGSGLMGRHREVPWLPKLVWNSNNARSALAEGHRHVVPIGAPFIYIDNGGSLASPGNGTLVYPHHSWEKDEMSADHHGYIAQIVERDGSGATVCLYWREYDDLKVRRLYESAGFRVICHGRREDPLFLERARAEILRHRRVVSNRVGTALWYAGHMERNVEVYGPLFVAQESTIEAWDSHRTAEHNWPELFSAGGTDSIAAREMAGVELGDVHRRTSEELREICRLDRPRTAALLDRLAVHATHDVLASAALTRSTVNRVLQR